MKKIELGRKDWTPGYYRKEWLEVMDGGSGQWLYAMAEGLRFVFIRIDDIVDSCGSDAWALFCASVQVVDLNDMPLDTIADVAKSHDLESDVFDLSKVENQVRLAEACLSHGAAATLWQVSGGKVTKTFEFGGHDERHPAFRKLRSDARKFAMTLADDETREAEMNKTANAIGSTHREMMRGDVWAALGRAAKNPNASDAQKLMLKIHGVQGVQNGN